MAKLPERLQVGERIRVEDLGERGGVVGTEQGKQVGVVPFALGEGDVVKQTDPVEGALDPVLELLHERSDGRAHPDTGVVLPHHPQ